ncbi:MAG: RNA polymerase sigma-70 factor [Sphingobacterium composti]|uniref:RNA polymerase sigma-70 factor n=1 Tax=Sphingobacterium composti TaxID=363260 RepID=UPI001356FF11|nr:RNA polymerase sigma-70 factor [Sphingobacterium composti Ten et al. 2007 non Yoo et al. 2007]
MKKEDFDLLEEIGQGSEQAFEILYKTYANILLHYVSHIIKDKEITENIVQDIFISLWSRRENLEIKGDLIAYLKSAAKNKIISYIRSENLRKKYIEHFNIFISQYQFDSIDNSINVQDLQSLIKDGIKTLPPKCAEVFYKSRFEHKSLDEIAEEMNISKRTVENYITQALKNLRLILKEYKWLIPLIFSGGKNII